MLNYTQATPYIVAAEHDWELVPICSVCWQQQHPGRSFDSRYNPEPEFNPDWLKGRPCYNCAQKRAPITRVYRSFPANTKGR